MMLTADDMPDLDQQDASEQPWLRSLCGWAVELLSTIPGLTST
jgi:hypothetical protein